MEAKSRNIWAIYGAVIACAFAIVLMVQNDYDNRASRLDLKIMTLELKGQSSVIDRMGVLRNYTRATAEKLQVVAVLFAVALALFSAAIATDGWGSRFLLGCSLLASMGGAGVILLALKGTVL